jgi:hypothetical protein
MAALGRQCKFLTHVLGKARHREGNMEKRQIKLKDLKWEEGASELASAENMRPYMDVYFAKFKNQDICPALEKIKQLPLERRYVWRVVSALKWAFADFDSMTVGMDRTTMSQEDLDKIREAIGTRAIQFFLFLRALLGAEEAEALMLQVVRADA